MNGPAELVLEVVDPGLEHALGLDGGVELGVLGEVAVTPGLGDLLGDPGHVLVLHLVELGLQLFIAFLRHRDSVTGHADLLPIPTHSFRMYDHAGCSKHAREVIPPGATRDRRKKRDFGRPDVALSRFVRSIKPSLPRFPTQAQPGGKRKGLKTSNALGAGEPQPSRRHRELRPDIGAVRLILEVASFVTEGLDRVHRAPRGGPGRGRRGCRWRPRC